MIIPELMKYIPVEKEEVKIVNTDVKKKITPAEEPLPSEVAEDSEEEEDDISDEEISVDDIKKRWEAFVNEVRPFNNHLYAFLENANITGFSEGVLTIDVPFSFHKERIEIPKSREIVSTVFKKVFGCSCKIVCNINDQMKKKSDAEFVLRNLPQAPKKEEKPKDAAPVEKKSFSKGRKDTAEIEAIFEGM